MSWVGKASPIFLTALSLVMLQPTVCRAAAIHFPVPPGRGGVLQLPRPAPDRRPPPEGASGYAAGQMKDMMGTPMLARAPKKVTGTKFGAYR